MTKSLTAAELAAARVRGARYRRRQRAGKGLIKWDARCGYDGAVLAMLILRGHLTESDSADPQKINGALTQFLFCEAYKEAPERIPKCVLRKIYGSSVGYTAVAHWQLSGKKTDCMSFAYEPPIQLR